MAKASANGTRYKPNPYPSCLLVGKFSIVSGFDTFPIADKIDNPMFGSIVCNESRILFVNHTTGYCSKKKALSVR